MTKLLIACHHIKKLFADQTVLHDVNLEIRAGERIGLVGSNGAGKSTLAGLLHGSLSADGGTISRHPSLTIGYLRQSTAYSVHPFDGMVGGTGDSAHPFAGLVEETSDSAYPFDDLVEKVNHSAHPLDDMVEMAIRKDGGEGFLAQTSRLGLSKVREWEPDRLAGLSGGERTKLAIAHIWSSQPDVLLLDEPTNHLDFLGVDWLVGQLRDYAGATLIISHDRYFLDQVVDRIVELEDGVCTPYAGNYTFYREEKARRYHSQLHQYEEQRKKEQQIEEEIGRLKRWSAKAHRDAGKTGKMAEAPITKPFYRSKAKKLDRQVSARIHKLEKLEQDGVKRPKEEARVRFELEEFAGKRGKRIVEAMGIAKGYGGRLLFQDTSFYIQRGERVGLLGPNGCGKTTLLRLLSGSEQVDAGTLWVSPTARFACLTQDVADLDPQRSVLELLRDAHAMRADVGKARTVLANMGLAESLLQKPVGKLSPGERTRVKLADLIMRDHDGLLLDEPTNHLDLASREQLETTLSSYGGTLIIVSHDRYFLEKTCDKLLVFESGRIRRIESDFRTYMENAEKARETGKAEPLKKSEMSNEREQAENAKKGDKVETVGIVEKEEKAGNTVKAEAAERAGKPDNAKMLGGAGQASVTAAGGGDELTARSREEEQMVVENRIATVLGKLGACVPGDPQYTILDREFKELVDQRNHLRKRDR